MNSNYDINQNGGFSRPSFTGQFPRNYSRDHFGDWSVPFPFPAPPPPMRPCPTCPTCPACPSLTCPTLPVLDSIHTVNKEEQAGTTDPSLIELGLDYITGTAITFTPDTTINLTEPGLYMVYYASNLVVGSQGNNINIAVLLKGESVPGSSINDYTFEQADTISFDKTVYVYNTSTSILQFAQEATSVDESIVDFTVTVIKQK